MPSISLLTSTGGTVNLSSTVLPDGTTAPNHVLVDGTGTAYGAANPLLTAPAIMAVAFTDRSGTVATSGANAIDIPASAARKGGSIRAATTNSGLITVTLRDAFGNTHAEHLAPGESYALTVNGYVIQDEILIAGDTVGDAFSGVTFQ